MNPTVIKIANLDPNVTDNGQMRVSTFEEAFGDFSEARGKGRARRQKRKLERQEKKKERIKAKSDKKRTRQQERIARRGERKASRQEMRNQQQEARMSRRSRLLDERQQRHEAKALRKSTDAQNEQELENLSAEQDQYRQNLEAEQGAYRDSLAPQDDQSQDGTDSGAGYDDSGDSGYTDSGSDDSGYDDSASQEDGYDDSGSEEDGYADDIASGDEDYSGGEDESSGDYYNAEGAKDKVIQITVSPLVQGQVDKIKKEEDSLEALKTRFDQARKVGNHTQGIKNQADRCNKRLDALYHSLDNYSNASGDTKEGAIKYAEIDMAFGSPKPSLNPKLVGIPNRFIQKARKFGATDDQILKAYKMKHGALPSEKMTAKSVASRKQAFDGVVYDSPATPDFMDAGELAPDVTPNFDLEYDANEIPAVIIDGKSYDSVPDSLKVDGEAKSGYDGTGKAKTTAPAMSTKNTVISLAIGVAIGAGLLYLAKKYKVFK